MKQSFEEKGDRKTYTKLLKWPQHTQIVEQIIKKNNRKEREEDSGAFEENS